MTNLIIGGTVAVVILIWLLSRPTDVQKLTSSISDLYGKSVGALVPK
jgi:hypothetical protein